MIEKNTREAYSKDDIKKFDKFRDILNEKIVDIDILRNMSW